MMKNFCVLIISLLILSSCSVQKRNAVICNYHQKRADIYCGVIPEKDSTHISIIETITIDTSYKPPDSSYIRLLLTCDSNNNVLIQELEIRDGKEIETEIIYINNGLIVKCKIDSQAVYKQYSEKIKVKTETKIIYKWKIKEVPVRHIPKIMWYFYVVVLIIGLFLGAKFSGIIKRLPFIK